MRASLYCLVGLVIGVGAVQAEPTSRVGTSYYYIEGKSALVLIAQMDKKGPVGIDGRNHPSRTKWDVQWRFRHNMHGGVCKMEKVSVAAGVTTVRPRWREKEQGAATLKKRWNQLIEAVNQHALHHKQLALDAATGIENALNALSSMDTCEALTEEADRVAKEILGAHQNASRDYDRSTDYGRKNGVSLI